MSIDKVSARVAVAWNWIFYKSKIDVDCPLSVILMQSVMIHHLNTKENIRLSESWQFWPHDTITRSQLPKSSTLYLFCNKIKHSCNWTPFSVNMKICTFLTLHHTGARTHSHFHLWEPAQGMNSHCHLEITLALCFECAAAYETPMCTPVSHRQCLTRQTSRWSQGDVLACLFACLFLGLRYGGAKAVSSAVVWKCQSQKIALIRKKISNNARNDFWVINDQFWNTSTSTKVSKIFSRKQALEELQLVCYCEMLRWELSKWACHTSLGSWVWNSHCGSVVPVACIRWGQFSVFFYGWIHA